MCLKFWAWTVQPITVVSTRQQVPPVPLGDLMLEQVQEMGPHFRYSGDHSEDNRYFFDLSGSLMITGREMTMMILMMVIVMMAVVTAFCFHPKWALTLASSLLGH